MRLAHRMPFSLHAPLLRDLRDLMRYPLQHPWESQEINGHDFNAMGV